ncbi:PP2C family protein-serine/threonine phosphatase [Planktothricoides raciborskii]|uniref:PP2C family protein-serine/threonine phosphatase n=1 Tax=Planktothricoides raciborskii TaxID=132608 RepID=UPI0028BD28C4|nr:protein phosphatase 2C domain-containing protein [Planktothricoides raciborskii]
MRTENQDAFLLEPWPDKSAILAVVADGMGGGHGGKRAAELAIETFRELLGEPLGKPRSENPEELPESLPEELPESLSEILYHKLIEKFYQADEKIRLEGSQSFQLIGMGTTVVAAIITPEECVHLYAGDSRLYHFREPQHLYKTADHSIVRILLEVGKITPEQVENHPMRSLLSSCLGGKEGTGQFSIDPKFGQQPSPFLPLQPNDIILLSSDGLHGHISDAEMQHLITENISNPEQLITALRDRALDQGGKDNITALIIQLQPNSQLS